MARWNAATWQPLPRNFGGTLRPVAVTLHHQAGSGNPFSIYLSRGVSAHFWIRRDGRVWQHVDTSRQAWHGMNHNQSSIGVETEGCGAPPHNEPLTNAQLNAFANLMRWANQAHGIPLQLSEAVGQRGLNYHNARGFSGSTACPCAVRRNARPEILRRARGNNPPGGSMQLPARVTRFEANGRESINQVAARYGITVWRIIDTGFATGRLSNENRAKTARYLAYPGRARPMPNRMPYWIPGR